MISPSLLLFGAAFVAPMLAGAQQSESATFYLLARGDTILVERQTRSATRVDGEFVDRTRGAHVAFSATLASDASITRLETRVTIGAGDTAAQRQTLIFTSDSLVIESGRGTVRTAVAAGAMPYINPSPSSMEQLLLRAKTLHTATAVIPLAPSSAGASATVTWAGNDSATLAFPGASVHLAVSATGRILGGAIPAQGLVIVRGSEIAPLAVERRDYSAPAGAPYTAQDVVFTTPAGIKLAGTLTLPSGVRGPVPAIVTLTGSGQQDRDETLTGITGYRPFRQIADTLGRRGIAVLRIDDRGVGGSGGDPRTETSGDYADDIRAAVAYLRSRPEIDPKRIGLLGHSEGGIVAPMVAASDSTIRALVLMAGTARTGRRILEYQLGRQIDRAPVSTAVRDSLRRLIPARLDSMAAMPWTRFFLTYDPATTARRVHTPVLILQGEGDIQVTPDQAPELAAAFRAGGNTHVTVRAFPKTNHLFLLDSQGDTDYAALPSKQVPAEVLGAIVDWLVSTMR